MSRIALSELVNERRGTSPEMAIRPAKAFGSTPEVWAGIQFDYDMAQAMKKADKINVPRLPIAADPGGGMTDPVPLFRRAVVTKQQTYELAPDQQGRPAAEVFGELTPRASAC
jgi:hypothetical protein